jgi:hypothetical protein
MRWETAPGPHAARTATIASRSDRDAGPTASATERSRHLPPIPDSTEHAVRSRRLQDAIARAHELYEQSGDARRRAKDLYRLVAEGRQPKRSPPANPRTHESAASPAFEEGTKAPR